MIVNMLIIKIGNANVIPGYNMNGVKNIYAKNGGAILVSTYMFLKPFMLHPWMACTLPYVDYEPDDNHVYGRITQ